MQERWQEIQSIWQNNQVLYVIAGFLAGILFFPAIEALATDASEQLSSFVPEAVGIAFTVLLIDRLYQRREHQRKAEELETRLLREADSRVNDTAIRAIEEIRKLGKLLGDDGLLRGAHFSWADLRGAPLDQANLEGAQLSNVDLRNTLLIGVKLKGAYLVACFLEGAWLITADLRSAQLWTSCFQGAYFNQANLEECNLFNARLENASFLGANLKGANLADSTLAGAYFNEMTQYDANTCLPDGSYWTSETDMTRFTDPNHPDFWEPEWVKEQREQEHQR